jgi:hypothetical protein
MRNGAALGQKQFFKLESLKNCGFLMLYKHDAQIKSNQIRTARHYRKKWLRHCNKQAKTFLTTTQVGTGNNKHD